MTARGNSANDMTDAFDFTQQPRPPLILNGTGSPYPPTPQSLVHPVGTLIATNAGYGTYALAPDAIASLYGAGLAATTQVAASIPLPVSLAGVSVTVKDAAGASRSAPLFFVSANQVNCLIPSGTASGIATITLTNGTLTSVGTASIGPTAPAVFTANSAGYGPLAAQVVVGSTFTNTSQCTGGQCVPVPIYLNTATNSTFLLLYGTGIRHVSSIAAVDVKVGNIDAPVHYAGAQQQFAGLDQVNVALPVALEGRGQLVVTITVDGQTTNMGVISFQ